MIRSSACPLRQADPAQFGRHGDRISYTTSRDIIAYRSRPAPISDPDVGLRYAMRVTAGEECHPTNVAGAAARRVLAGNGSARAAGCSLAVEKEVDVFNEGATSARRSVLGSLSIVPLVPRPRGAGRCSYSG